MAKRYSYPKVMKALMILISTLLTVNLFSACGGLGGDLVIGDKAPDFSLKSVDGNTISLSDYSGDPVLLYFHMAVG